MKTYLSILSLYILIGCGGAPRGIVDEGATSNPNSDNSLDDSFEGDSELSGEQFSVSFPGGAFSNGAITGEGIDCNRTSSDICKKDYPAGSQLRFEIPKTITANGQTLKFSGKIQCNGEESTIDKSAPVIYYEIPSLDKNYSCSFHFAP